MDVDMLKIVLATLENIDVKGRENISRMLGCMDVLSKMIEQEKRGEQDG